LVFGFKKDIQLDNINYPVAKVNSGLCIILVDKQLSPLD